MKYPQFKLWVLISILLNFTLLTAQPHGGMRGGVQRQSMDPRKAPKIGMIFGTVVDSATQTPIPYASVSVISQRSGEIVTGGITDDSGKFYIKEIPLGRHHILIEYIGYQKQILGPLTFLPFGDNVTEHNLENILLVQTTLQMEAVEVEGERPLFIQTAQKRIFNVEKNTLSTGGSAIDALRQVPGIEVDMDDNISLRGSANVNLMIDGKPSSIASGDKKALLQSIPAANIADVEVMTNPGAKYDPEGMAGIINIVLKENKFAGLNGSLNSSADSQEGLNSSGQINWRTVKVNTFANLGFRRHIREGFGESYRTMTFDTIEERLDQESEGKRSGDNVFIKSGVEVFFDPSQSLSLSATLNTGDRGYNNLVHSVETGSESIAYDRLTTDYSDRGGTDINLTYDKKFSDPKHKLTTFMRWSSGNNTGSSLFKTTTTSHSSLALFSDTKTVQDGKDENIDIQADYSRPLTNDARLDLGFKNTRRIRDDNQLYYDYVNETGTFVSASEQDNRFLYNENIWAAYAQFDGTIGMFGINVGGRIEKVSMTSELKNTEEYFKNPYTSFFPSFSLSTGAPEILQIQISYSKRIHRPRSRQMNPFISYRDLKNFYSGNPFLKPEYIDSYEVNIGKYTRGLSLSFGGYYRHTTDKINRYKTVDEHGVSFTTYENFDEMKTRGIEYTLVGSLGRKFRIMLGGNVYWDEVNSDLFEDNYDKTARGQSIRFTTTWNMNRTTEMMFFMFYRSPRDIPIGKIGSMSFSAISLKKKFMDEKLNLSVKVGDPFNLSGFSFEAWGEEWYQSSTRKWMSQTVTVGLEYRFGKMEDKSRFNRSRNQNGRGDDMGNGEFGIE